MKRVNKNQTIEKKIQEDVKKSIKTQQEDRLSPKIIKKEMFEAPTFVPLIFNRVGLVFAGSFSVVILPATLAVAVV